MIKGAQEARISKPGTKPLFSCKFAKMLKIAKNGCMHFWQRFFAKVFRQKMLNLVKTVFDIEQLTLKYCFYEKINDYRHRP